ncbi:hypothetical protein ACLOJK_011728 [Asimina triloba]
MACRSYNDRFQLLEMFHLWSQAFHSAIHCWYRSLPVGEWGRELWGRELSFTSQIGHFQLEWGFGELRFALLSFAESWTSASSVPMR